MCDNKARDPLSIRADSAHLDLINPGNPARNSFIVNGFRRDISVQDNQPLILDKKIATPVVLEK